MARTIESPRANQQDFHPLVGIRSIGNYVKGKVTKVGFTVNKNPVITMELLDLDGSTAKSVAKGQYEEVEVSVGDLVQMVGSTTDLKAKLPLVNVGDIVTITYEKEIPTKRGRPMKIFKVEVDE